MINLKFEQIITEQPQGCYPDKLKKMWWETTISSFSLALNFTQRSEEVA